MAKTKLPTPPNWNEFSGLGVKLKTESDRAKALIVTAWLDDSICGYLKSLFLQGGKDAKTVDEMLGGSGPLGTLSARMKLVYLLGTVSKGLFDILDTIRDIRNKFAHSRSDLAFSTQQIRDLCKNLGAEDVTEPADQFMLAGLLLAAFFVSKTEELTAPAHPSPPAASP